MEFRDAMKVMMCDLSKKLHENKPKYKVDDDLGSWWHERKCTEPIIKVPNT